MQTVKRIILVFSMITVVFTLQAQPQYLHRHPKTKSAMTFAVVSDPHLALPTSNTGNATVKMLDSSVALMQSALDDIAKIKNLDFIVFPGDLTKDAEPWAIDKFVEMLEDFPLDVPMYCVLGNHEHPPIPLKDADPSMAHLIGSSRAVSIAALKGYGIQSAHGWWSTDVAPWLHLVGLNTTKTGTWGGKVTKAQLNWLDDDLSKNHSKVIIVVGHHGLVRFAEEESVEQWDNYYLDNADEVINVLEKHPDVACYLHGHRHVSTVPVERNSIHYIENASTVTYPMSYTIYTVSRKSISYKVHRVKASDELWATAKQNMINDPGQYPEHSDGSLFSVDEFLNYIEQPEFLEVTLPIR